MSAILDNLNFVSTEEHEPCTQDNPKKMNPNELAYYFRDALQFTISGGCVEVKISSCLVAQLCWHPYFSLIFSQFNLSEDLTSQIDILIEKGEKEFKDQTDLEFYIAQRRFKDGIHQLNVPSPMGLSIREHALKLALNSTNDKVNLISQCLLNPDPATLVKLKDTIRRAAELKPANLADDTGFSQLQEYQLLIHSDKAHLLEDVVFSVGTLVNRLKVILEKIADEKKQEFWGHGRLAYQNFLSILALWEGVKKMPESVWVGGNLNLKTKLDPEILNFLKEIDKFSLQFTPILGGWCTFDEIRSKKDIEIHLNRIVEHLQDLSLICHQKADDFIKRLNAGNTSNYELKEWGEEVESILNDINSKKVLKHNLETNTRNFYQFYLTLHQNHKKLNRALDFSKAYPDIMAWKAFLDTLEPAALQLIDVLNPLPTGKWIENFDQAAHHLFFERWQNPAVLDSEEVIRVAGVSQMIKWKQIAQSDNLRFKNQGSEFEKENTSFRNKVGKWLNLSKEANKTTTAHAGIGQFVISLSEDMGNEINFRLKSEEGPSSEWLIEVEIIKGINALSKIGKKIDDYAITDRFSVAKTVADVIMEMKCEVRVFQLKSANILCLLPEVLSNTLLRELDDLGIKEFQGRTSNKDSIIESIIETKRKQILLLFNGLPIDQLNAEIEEQFLLIEKIKMLGFVTHSIWASNIIAKGGSPCFEELRKELSH